MDRAKAARLAARQFEGVKLALTHKKDGYHLTLVVQPNDMDSDIFTDFIGQRYGVVMVPIGDDEQPVVSDKRIRQDRMVIQAALLPKETPFWDYLEWLDPDATIRSEEDATSWLKTYLNIGSRSELKDNEEAREAFDGMIGEFEEWRSKRST